MKKGAMVPTLFVLTGFLFGFTPGQKPQKDLIPGAKSYSAHFPALHKSTDGKGDGEGF